MTEERDANPNRRRVLQCMAWAGTGLVWTVVGGVPKSLQLGGEAIAAESGSFSFVQISDSHIGFNKEANPTPTRHCRRRSTASPNCPSHRRWWSIPVM